jgi:PIN domain nuclease of toxin-antitoxin system
LLDTQLLLWLASEEDRLSESVLTIVNDESIASMFSVASMWEVAIKTSLKRPDFQVDGRVLRRGLLEAGFPELPIEAQHVLAVQDLPDIHGDPFDRLLVAQARVEGLILLTTDILLAEYGADVRVVKLACRSSPFPMMARWAHGNWPEPHRRTPAHSAPG